MAEEPSTADLMVRNSCTQSVPAKTNVVIHSPTRTFLQDRNKLPGKIFRLTVYRGNQGYPHIETEEEVPDIEEGAE